MLDVLSDSDELLIWSPSRYCIKLSFFVKSGGSANEGNGSVIEMVRLGGDGAESGLCGDMALAERFREPGLFGDFPGDGIMGSRTGGWGESEVIFSLSWCTLIFGGRPGFLEGVLAAGLESLRTPFLLKRTAVRRFTPGVGVEAEDLSEDCTLVGVPGLEFKPSCVLSS